MPTAPTPERWIEINLDAIVDNARHIRQHLNSETKLLAVVKANAYGMGAVSVAKALAPEVDMLAVSTSEEGIELRNNGIKTPVLVFIPPTAHTIEKLIKHDLTISIDSQETLDLLSTFGANNHPCHLKINSGMNRLGCSLDKAAVLAYSIHNSPAAKLDGVYSHLASAADTLAATKQINIFQQALDNITALEVDYGLAHLANSTAILKLGCQFDMVRAGTILYGQSPIKLPHDWELKNPWKVFCRIVAVRDVKKGEAIGYGGDFLAKKDLRIGIIPLGYADGFALEPHTRNGSIGAVFRKGIRDTARIIAKRPLYYAFYREQQKIKKIPIVGRIGMQLTAVDLSHCSLNKGDILQISLRRTSANSRLCRLFLQDGQIVEQQSIT
ncbi:MAG: alanine racemase [Bacillota bacterium]|jgi:alanine racemase